MVVSPSGHGSHSRSVSAVPSSLTRDPGRQSFQSSQASESGCVLKVPKEHPTQLSPPSARCQYPPAAQLMGEELDEGAAVVPPETDGLALLLPDDDGTAASTGQLEQLGLAASSDASREIAVALGRLLAFCLAPIPSSFETQAVENSSPTRAKRAFEQLDFTVGGYQWRAQQCNAGRRWTVDPGPASTGPGHCSRTNTSQLASVAAQVSTTSPHGSVNAEGAIPWVWSHRPSTRWHRTIFGL